MRQYQANASPPRLRQTSSAKAAASNPLKAAKSPSLPANALVTSLSGPTDPTLMDAAPYANPLLCKLLVVVSIWTGVIRFGLVCASLLEAETTCYGPDDPSTGLCAPNNPKSCALT
jgi:hypothetical protein